MSINYKSYDARRNEGTVFIRHPMFSASDSAWFSTSPTLTMGHTTQEELNPRTKRYEFLGPPGAFFIILTVPPIMYALSLGCSESSGGCPPPLQKIIPGIIDAVSDVAWWKSLFDKQAFIIYLAWYACTVVAWAVLPGDWIDGTLLRDGSRKKYKINGMYSVEYDRLLHLQIVIAFSTFLLTLGLVFGLIFRFGPESFTFIYERYVGFLTASLILSIFQALCCYFASFWGNKLLALGGNT